MQLHKQLLKFFSSLVSIESKDEEPKLVAQERKLWNNKSIREDSVVLWDLENIPFKRLEEIKRVAKYTPDKCFVITKQKLSQKKRNHIEKQNFTILDAHKTISDDKIVAIMKLYSEKKDMMLISADSDFAREANRYIKNNRLQWILTDNNKKRVTMFVNLASTNLTISTIIKEKQIQIQRRTLSTKKKANPLQESSFTPNKITIATWISYYRGRVSAFLKYTKSLVVEHSEKRIIQEQKESAPTPIDTPQKKKTTSKKKPKKNPTVENEYYINPDTGVGIRYVYRHNHKNQEVVCGKVQDNPSGTRFLLLYKNLANKYNMPPFKTKIAFIDNEDIVELIQWDEEEKKYSLQEFDRKEN